MAAQLPAVAEPPRSSTVQNNAATADKVPGTSAPAENRGPGAVQTTPTGRPSRMLTSMDAVMQLHQEEQQKKLQVKTLAEELPDLPPPPPGVLAPAVQQLQAQIESSMPSLHSVLTISEHRLEGSVWVVTSPSTTAQQQVQQNGEFLLAEIRRLLDHEAIRLRTEVGKVQVVIDRPPTMDELRQQMEEQNPTFRLFQQAFQTRIAKGGD